ncbi:hypothetical protein T05_10829 [Trichinella murrelli]|uniref:Uncharacterized protein n=1 Tax=Trichinella murrelli TaxID=144512 RepID=A0A0V0UEZ5_9BILA|nr:hypothetical protein T05_10829 [Trichinella murrelli]
MQTLFLKIGQSIIIKLVLTRHFVTLIKEYFNESYVADIDFHLKFRFLIFFYWSRVTDKRYFIIGNFSSLNFKIEFLQRRVEIISIVGVKSLFITFGLFFSSEDLGLCSSSSSIASWLFLQ